jgi:hypothetical protein
MMIQELSKNVKLYYSSGANLCHDNKHYEIGMQSSCSERIIIRKIPTESFKGVVP